MKNLVKIAWAINSMISQLPKQERFSYLEDDSWEKLADVIKEVSKCDSENFNPRTVFDYNEQT